MQPVLHYRQAHRISSGKLCVVINTDTAIDLSVIQQSKTRDLQTIKDFIV